MTVSEAIISWLKEFQPSDAWPMKKINTDLMHTDVDYALVKEPIRNVKTYISGTKIITEHYQIVARLDVCSDRDSVENGAWFEKLTDWIEERNQNQVFPKLQEGLEVQDIGVSSPFYMGMTKDRKAIYQMTIFIRYKKEVTNI